IINSTKIEWKKSTLQIVQLLGVTTDYPNFSRIFNSGLTILKEDLSDQDKAKLVVAATRIFGSMGSWNDSPPWSAQQLNMEKEFEEITSEFYEKRKQLMQRIV
ncbi:hypothetical protein HCJ62_06600, partial [Listeria welshimeri]|nr:hypothetical protein [Listeria welshimeri]